MGKLSDKQREVLAVIPDWSAPYEIRERLDGEPVMYVLDRLLVEGLVEYGRPNHTYRITDAGRAALAQQGPET